MSPALAFARPRHARRAILGTLAIVCGAVLFLMITATEANAQSDLEQCFLDKINAERAAVGAPTLQWAEDLAPYTREHSADMAATGDLYHSSNSQMDAVLPDSWHAWGENVGYISTVDCDAMHEGFMNSTGHRDNLLNGTYRFGATGVHIDGNGWLWTTHVFFAATGYSPGGSSSSGTFVDDDGSTFEGYIESLVAAGVTNGCGGAYYCPKQLVDREQMAAFLNRALNLPARGDFGFRDVTSSSTFFDDINAIAWEGITQGCGNGYYCPFDPVTRAQMAAFLVRALNLPAAPDAGFKDVPSSDTFADAINRLAAAGVTNGCTTGYFCPNEPVNREQMAAFLVRALGL